MKDYREMAESVLARRDQYNAQKKAQRRRILTALSCFCLVALLGVGVWRAGLAGPLPDASSTASGNAESVSGTSSGGAVDPVSDGIVWLSAAELLADGEGNAAMGVYVPTFIAYRGAFYGGTDFAIEEGRFAPTDSVVSFNKEYQYTAYQVEGEPDLVAIRINGGLSVYQKRFDVTFALDGITYGIAYSPVMEMDDTCGDIILSTEDFTVYRAVRLQGEPGSAAEYIVDILPKLRKELPNFFGEDENYRDALWIAVPLNEEQPTGR